jgi:ribose/xylose/arabinose/galactoside ABC-type transport system permease subunit
MNPGRALIILGVFITLAGIFLTFGDKLPIRLGRLPGDIKVEGKDSVFYFPIATSLIVSVVLSLVMWLFNRR